MDHGNTNTPSMHSGLRSANLSQLALTGESQLDFLLGEIPMGQYSYEEKKSSPDIRHCPTVKSKSVCSHCKCMLCPTVVHQWHKSGSGPLYSSTTVTLFMPFVGRYPPLVVFSGSALFIVYSSLRVTAGAEIKVLSPEIPDLFPR